MTRLRLLLCLLVVGAFAQAEEPVQMVRAVVWNELNDHQHHGYWRFHVNRRTADGVRQSEQIETADGPLERLVAMNGHRLDAQAEHEEEARIAALLHSPEAQAKLRSDHAADEQRIGRILALLPDAFVYEDRGIQNGQRHLSFRPNPRYPAHSIEARIFHAMSGDLWIETRSLHLSRLEGHLTENVDFGWGLLGRLYQGGWFVLARRQVSGTDWKTAQLEIHMTGRALLFKSIARETSEERSGFRAVAAGLDLAGANEILARSHERPSDNATIARVER